jgi:hypothetical protein
MARFSAGIAGGVAVGLGVFRGAALDPRHPAFECLSVGALVSGMLTVARLGHRGQALVLALAFAGVRCAMTPGGRLQAAVAGLGLGLGLTLVALVFEGLARAGWRFGKFLIVGPLVGGVFLALAPLTEAAAMNVYNAGGLLLLRLALGVLIGEGVALGVELAELGLARHAGSDPGRTRADVPK